MKKYKIIIAIVALSGILSSCGDDYLKLYPFTDVVAGAPATRDIIEQNITGCYQILYFDCFASGLWMPVNGFYDGLADDIYTGGEHAGDQPHFQRAATYTSSPSLDPPSGWWSIFYAGLKRCNGALNTIENAVDVSPTQLAQMKAEVLTLRAYYVHWLWKGYGNIPYFENIWTEEPFTAPQYKFEDIYQELLADLDEAINTADFPMTTTESNRGRVTKAMAMMTRARIVLYYKDQSRYAEVLNDMKTIINNGAYKLVTTAGANNFTGLQGSNDGANSPATTNPFEWIFLRDGEFSSESIFEVNHKSDPAKQWGNAWTGVANYNPRFTAPREAASDKTFQTGWGFCPVRPDAYAIFDADDYRRDATVSNWGTGNGSGYQNTGLWLRKYAARWGYNVGTRGDRDLGFENNKRIYRVAEAYLNAAELELVAGGGQGAAQPFLDAIRDRAFGDTGHRIPATLNNIKLERRKEFFGEGLRFWDLLRWGSDENDRPIATVLSTNNEYQTRTWNDSRKFLPIPQNEIERVAGTDNELQQNPGY
ncbi:MAG: RagB/SusD family nutrient uptake outer membrane protein [Tannerella sp.]|jgi:hypothetical protein|nr:RagB/SusD family nutrient uptake outer membrane protein [Tannerella sp.]